MSNHLEVHLTPPRNHTTIIESICTGIFFSQLGSDLIFVPNSSLGYLIYISIDTRLTYIYLLVEPIGKLVIKSLRCILGSP